jgi:hypothetical protein
MRRQCSAALRQSDGAAAINGMRREADMSSVRNANLSVSGAFLSASTERCGFAFDC